MLTVEEDGVDEEPSGITLYGADGHEEPPAPTPVKRSRPPSSAATPIKLEPTCVACIHGLCVRRVLFLLFCTADLDRAR